MKILVVEDDLTSRKVLGAMLAKLGHEVVTAGDGRAAQDVFAAEQPDLVLMDVMMPVMDGYEAAALIKSRGGSRFTPIIFVTAMTDDAALARCVESGGDDFLPKPYNRVLLKAKIDAMSRIRGLYDEAARRRDELARERAQTEEDMRLARRVFDYISSGASPKGVCLRHLNWAVGRWSGDFLLRAETPAGRVHVMVGDFTGHGLAAAVGTLPTADLFYEMSARDESIGSIAARVGGKLRRCLPVGFFCAAALTSLDPATGHVEIWNGGLPDALVLDPTGHAAHRVASSKVPLGVLPGDQVDQTVERFRAADGWSVLVASDGLTEATGPEGRAFGVDRLAAAAAEAGSPSRVFETVRRGVMAWTSERAPGDDLSLVQVVIMPPDRAGQMREQTITFSDQSAELRLPGCALAMTDPMDVLTSWPGIKDLDPHHRGRLCTVLAELISNAIDHGVLRLDPGLRATADGFDAYHRVRAERLTGSDEGSLTIAVERIEGADGLAVRIRVEDSGAGFDASCLSPEPALVTAYHGRGISLVRAMGATLDYRGRGNVVEADYRVAA